MDEHDRAARSGAQTVLDGARTAKTVVRVARAAAATGLPGAAAAAVKETLPLIGKIAAVGVLLLLLPMLVFVSLPNIFFGYDSALAADVSEMTDQALLIGTAYLDLEEFERAQMDAIVTRLVAEYAEQGIAIDSIEVSSSLDEEDLYWFIAINSVAEQQDLFAMSVMDIRDLGTSRIVYTPSLLQFITGEGESEIVTATLKVEFDALEPEKLMDRLAFDDEERNWAQVLFRTLEENDALNTYGDRFTAQLPDYSGDSGFSADYQRGDGLSNDIDTSGFVDPDTKNNLGLAAYALQAYENGWGYVWGTYGHVLTQSLLDYKAEQYPDGVGNYKTFIETHWLGRRTTDCVGLIKGYGWLDAGTGIIGYAVNGMPDYSADQMYAAATVKGAMSTMPDTPGIAVWKSGHIGVYVGDGMVVEAVGTRYGVVMTRLEDRTWSGWCQIPFITYAEGEDEHG